jgi:hypothetical protein
LFNHDFRLSATDNCLDRIGIKYIGDRSAAYVRWVLEQSRQTYSVYLRKCITAKVT